MSPTVPREQQLVEAAAQLIGVRFRLHGRDPAIGIDCIGLVACSLSAIGWAVAPPSGYRLRNAEPLRWLECAARSGLKSADGPVTSGDIVLLEVGACQQHLVIAERHDICIHAHAGLRRVVRQPIVFPQKSLARWRLV